MTVKELRKYLKRVPDNDTVFIDTPKQMYLIHIDEVQIRMDHTDLQSFVVLKSLGENG